MKTKDIVILGVATVIIGASSFFLYRMLVPAKAKTVVTVDQNKTPAITGDIDTETLKLISEKKDYGEATLDNIGRTNPFGPLN
jgi:hypothetical protein